MGTQFPLCFVTIAYIYSIKFEQLLTYLHANGYTKIVITYKFSYFQLYELKHLGETI